MAGKVGGKQEGAARGPAPDTTDGSFSKNWNSPLNVNNTKDSNPPNEGLKGKFSPKNPLGIPGIGKA